MALYKIRKGRNLPIIGQPEARLENAKPAQRYALLPQNFAGVKFKLEVGVGDKVRVGSPLMSSRLNPDLKFTSPAGGLVKEINRGEKRRLLEIVIEAYEPDDEEFETFESYSSSEIKNLDRGSVVEHLLKSGLWPYMLQRPFSRIADPTVTPKSIFVNAMDTEPNCADKQILLQNAGPAFQAGLDLLNRLTEGKVFLCYDGNAQNIAKVISECRGVEVHQFQGAHPAGNVGTHIHYLDPINKGDHVWHINGENLVLWGRLFLEGKVPVERIVALGGSACSDRRYIKTRLGAPLSDVIGSNISDAVRVIAGGVLTGQTTKTTSYLDYYHSTLTFIPEGGDKEFIGWMKPGFDKPTFSRMFLSAFLPPKQHVMDTKINGETRAIVATHIYDQLVTLDVYTNFLVKACIAQDVEAMEQLGLLECAPEDFALCTYACVSKLEVETIIRQGLELLEKES